MKAKTIIIIVVVLLVIGGIIYFFTKKPSVEIMRQQLIDDISKTEGPKAIEKLKALSDEEISTVWDFYFNYLKNKVAPSGSLKEKIEVISKKYDIFT